MTELGEFAMYLALGFTSLGLLFGPVGHALGRRLGDRTRSDSTSAELEELRVRIAEIEAAQHHRIGDVEERLDFAERMLAQREPDRLEGVRNA